MMRNPSVSTHLFSMVPSADVPRSSFVQESGLKTSIDGGYLYPIYCEEALPGDTWNLDATIVCRLATPLFPVMDNLYIDDFWFFVPYRLVWENWVRMNGEQDSPGASTSYTVPQITSKAGGYDALSIYDYFELPCAGQISAGETYQHSALPLRAYALIFNKWFRDENLSNPYTIPMGDGPDLYTLYGLERRGKRHDYFTGCLPWTQKSTTPVSVPIGGFAPVRGLGVVPAAPTAGPVGVLDTDQGATSYANFFDNTPAIPTLFVDTNAVGEPQVFANLNAVSAFTVNQLRLSFQMQRLLERDARGGTRYTEVLFAHFKVRSPDARLQRPEYLGGGSTLITINPVAQTSGTPATGTPQGNLSAFGQAVVRHGFTSSFVEHGCVIGIVSVRADLTYQQGMRRFWSRQTRFDFYWPAFAMLGEQAVLNQEIYCTGTATDTDVFGYQERWAEYRYHPSAVTGLMRSTNPNTIDPWHLAQEFLALPTLNNTFIKENPPLERIIAVGADAAGQQLILDGFFRNRMARPMPLYSVPGMIDHF